MTTGTETTTERKQLTGIGLHTDQEEIEELDGFVCHLLREPSGQQPIDGLMSFCGEHGASGIREAAFRPGGVGGSPAQSPCPVCGRNRCRRCAETYEAEH